ncbi:hypothetical protein [Litoribrevibacter albus]|uniref:Uncharacterized protein n=1 Tax=Litoribrevibacter albus TaxID=1473156 RepID=A0AA37SAF3_9GAMM|nr:hypothetical protein [Litoribrevibacter albus]GLQ31659.1 hypothetical protein GCM10007876_21380 [Litoribrevibacter albus]
MAHEITKDFRFSENGAIVTDYTQGQQFESLPENTLKYATENKFVKTIKAVDKPKDEDA